MSQKEESEEMRESKNLNDYWPNIIFLALAILILNLWVTHQFGGQWMSYAVPNATILLLGIITSFFKIFSKEEREEANNRLKRIFLTFLKPIYLVAIYFIILVLGSVFSSVTVMADGISDRMRIRLADEQPDPKLDSGKLEGINDIMRFFKVSSPFGKPYYIEVEGYNRYSFDLYSWIGKKIRVDKDLERTPSILFRIPTDVHSLLSTGKIVVYLAEDSLFSVSTTDKNGAILVSSYNASGYLNSFENNWRLELQSQGIVGETAARSLIKWKKPILVKLKVELSRGLRIKVEFLSINNDRKAIADYTITTESIQDVLLDIYN